MFGGLVQSDDEDGLMYRANKEMWKFDLEKQRWSGPDVSLFVCLFVLTIFNEEAYCFWLFWLFFRRIQCFPFSV